MENEIEVLLNCVKTLAHYESMEGVNGHTPHPLPSSPSSPSSFPPLLPPPPPPPPSALLEMRSALQATEGLCVFDTQAVWSTVQD